MVGEADALSSELADDLLHDRASGSLTEFLATTPPKPPELCAAPIKRIVADRGMLVDLVIVLRDTHLRSADMVNDVPHNLSSG